MLFKKSLGRDHPPYNFGMRLFLVLPLLSLLTSCTTFIPGIDRILFSNSSAKVGPLVTVYEQYPANDDEVSASSENESIVEPVTDSGAVPTSNAMDHQPPTTKIKLANTSGFESPDSVADEIATEKEPVEIAVEYGSVAGKVVLIGDEEQILSATGTMITLTPKAMMDEVQDRPSQVHIIDMEDKTYLPRYSTIQAGDLVVFANKDKIRHNVFSSSGNNAFDLGTYDAGLKRAVTLKEPGIVKIYCNIHSEMATFIAVGNQGLSVKTDDQGRYQISEVLPGTYEVAIWNIRGETKRIVEVKADEMIELADRIDTTAFKVEPHKNKFGGNYSKNSTLFEDEFY